MSSASPRDLKPVLDNGLCIACGACVHATPGLRLELDADRLMYQPSGVGDEAAASVCPAIAVDFDGLQRWLFPGAEATPLGVVHSVHLAQSTDHDRNLRASSGGIIKELMLQALADPAIDGVISLDHAEGLLFEPRLVTEAAEVDRLPGSIYHSVPFDKALSILRDRPGRYLLVAIPCQLEGIFQYIRTREPHLRERIHMTIGLVCGWTYSHHALEAIATFKGVDLGAVTDVAYRGGGPVGALRLTTPTGVTTVHRRVNFAYQVAFDRSFNVPRCHLCVDHTNFLADLVVGDAWLPSTLGTRTGISLVVCRNDRARAALDRLVADARVIATDISVEDVVESQTRRVAYGDFAYALAEHLRTRGEFVPEMTGPNRSAAILVPERDVERFVRENTLKLKMQRQRRYRALYRRKLTAELGRFLMRYVRWFAVRVLRVKSLTGRRQEIPAEKLRQFR